MINLKLILCLLESIPKFIWWTSSTICNKNGIEMGKEIKQLNEKGFCRDPRIANPIEIINNWFSIHKDNTKKTFTMAKLRVTSCCSNNKPNGNPKNNDEHIINHKDNIFISIQSVDKSLYKLFLKLVNLFSCINSQVNWKFIKEEILSIMIKSITTQEIGIVSI